MKKALDIFKEKAGIPAAFGEAQPYVRMAYVDESGAAGADADVEFDGDIERVIVTVTEWDKDGERVVRSPDLSRVEFDLTTGAIVGCDDPGEALSNLLVVVDGMKVLGEGA